MTNWPRVRAWISAHQAWLWVAALGLLIDRATKVWALAALPDYPRPLAKYFWLTYVENTGAAFGMFQNGNALLIVVMIVVIAFIVCSWQDIARYGKIAQWGGVLILTGAVGNLYDRVTLGFVVDFLDFRVWPVFNVADSCITVGAVLIGVGLLLSHAKQEKL